MAKPEFLDEGEQLIDKWTINYKAHNGGFYNGILYVTNKRLVYDAKFDLSLKGFAEAYVLIMGSYFYLAIPKDHIQVIDEKSSFFKKQLILTLINGDVHTFDYGMLSVKKILEAIKQ